MDKNVLKIILTLMLFVLQLVFCLSFSPFAFAREDITITAYYPSPYGVYDELRADRMSVGSNYRSQPLNDGDFFVEGNMGIGRFDTGFYDSKQTILDVEGYTAANDVWLKDISMWAGQISSTYTLVGPTQCFSGDTLVAVRYTPNSCSGVCECECDGSTQCSVSQDTWDYSGTLNNRQSCGYHDHKYNNYGNCWQYNNKTCWANIAAITCAAP